MPSSTPSPDRGAALLAPPTREEHRGRVGAPAARAWELEADTDGDARYRALAEVCPDALLVNADGRYVFANAAAARLLGAERADQIVGRSPLEFVEPRYYDLIRERHRQVLEERRPAALIEYRWRRLDGSIVDVEVAAGPLPWQGTTAVQVVARDITARKRVEAALRLSEERFRIALQHSTITVASCDRDLRYTWIHNPHPAFDAPAVLGRRDDELAPAEDVRELVRLKEDVLASGRGVHREIPITVQAELRHYDITAGPLRDDSGAVVGVTTAAADVTVSRRLEQAAHEASLAKSGFLSTMSHELRTPLTAVIGLADLLESEVSGPVNARQKAHLSRIVASGWHLVGLIDEILTLARADAGREEARLADVDVAEIARDVVAMLANVAHGRGLVLSLHGADEPVAAHTDAGKVRRIALNLVGNAIKYTPSGRVEVELPADGPDVVLRVRDTGVGIPAERLEEIFEPFVQLDDSSLPRGGGTGLGLAICRRLARLLGGDVWAESVPGEGSTFTLRLPCLRGRRT